MPRRHAGAFSFTADSMSNKTKRLAELAVFTTLAMILSYIESLIPFNFGIPGVKLGLSNLIALFALIRWGSGEAFTINIMRVLLTGFLFGNGFAILYSLSGALMSLVAMSLSHRAKAFSVMGIGVTGGIFHNIGQLIIACLTVADLKIMFYLPVLIVSGAVTGLIVGFLAGEMLKRLP